MSKILLLEDDLSLINGLSFAFRKAGYELDIARTVRDADSLYRDGQYDLLVLDVTLPDGSGFDICRKVREVSSVPIIFLTASDGKPASSWDWTSAETTILQSLSSWRCSCPESVQFSAEASIFSKHPGNCAQVGLPFNCWRDLPIKTVYQWN